jgi:hypothetical protein
MKKIRKTYQILHSLFSERKEAVSYVFKHVIKIRELAVFLIEKDEITNIDKEAVEWGSLLHDVGRLLPLENPIWHGVEGAKLIEQEPVFSFLAAPLRDKVINITRNHVGCGLENYVPQNIEELLVSFTDNIFAGDKLMGINWAAERFTRELSPEHGKKVISQMKQLQQAGFNLEFLY